jgi:hypothetical protein
LQLFVSAQLVPSVTGAFTHPRFGSHESAVHGFASSQFTDAPRQSPPRHASPVVHALPSLQSVVSGKSTLLHTLAAQLSVVHVFPSLQFGPPEPAHTPPVH